LYVKIHNYHLKTSKTFIMTIIFMSNANHSVYYTCTAWDNCVSFTAWF